LYTLAS